jgi:hypothetical protein
METRIWDKLMAFSRSRWENLLGFRRVRSSCIYMAPLFLARLLVADSSKGRGRRAGVGMGWSAFVKSSPLGRGIGRTHIVEMTISSLSVNTNATLRAAGSKRAQSIEERIESLHNIID